MQAMEAGAGAELLENSQDDFNRVVMIISNTTPIIALSSIGRLDLMRLDWLHCMESKNYPHNPLLISMNDREKHSTEAALIHKADFALINEKLGRNSAEFLGLKVTGTLGILLRIWLAITSLNPFVVSLSNHSILRQAQDERLI